jgi:hypothetical protein
MFNHQFYGEALLTIAAIAEVAILRAMVFA